MEGHRRTDGDGKDTLTRRCDALVESLNSWSSSRAGSYLLVYLCGASKLDYLQAPWSIPSVVSEFVQTAQAPETSFRQAQQ